MFRPGSTIEELRNNSFVVDVLEGEKLPDTYLPLTDEGIPDWDTLWLESRLTQGDRFNQSVALRAPVTSLTIVRPALDDEACEVLIAIRSGEGNVTHPNVISVPTKRSYYDWFGLAVEFNQVEGILTDDTGSPYGAIFEPSPDITATHDESTEHFNFRSESVRSMLSWKLDSEDGWDPRGGTHWGRRNFVVAGGSFMLGNSQIDYNPKLATTTVERIAMHNIIMGVDRETWFPDANRHYSRLGWIGLSRFNQLVETKDVMAVDDVFKGEMDFDTCVHGVCIASTSAIFSQPALAEVTETLMNGIGNKPAKHIVRGQVC